MNIDLNELPWQITYAIVEYCVEHIIEPKKCYQFLYWHHFRNNNAADLDLIFDIPEEHITWMRLKGIL